MEILFLWSGRISLSRDKRVHPDLTLCTATCVPGNVSGVLGKASSAGDGKMLHRTNVPFPGSELPVCSQKATGEDAASIRILQRLAAYTAQLSVYVLWRCNSCACLTYRKSEGKLSVPNPQSGFLLNGVCQHVSSEFF